MIQLIFIIHVLSAVCLIALVLMQQGKGADMGAGFGGGASQTIFGSMGTVPFLAKITAVVATIFFISSLTLGYITAKQVKHSSSVAIEQPLPVPIDNSPIIPPAPAPKK